MTFNEFQVWVEKNKLPLAGAFVATTGALVIYGAFSPEQKKLRDEERAREDRMLWSFGLDPDAVRTVRRFR